MRAPMGRALSASRARTRRTLLAIPATMVALAVAGAQVTGQDEGAEVATLTGVAAYTCPSTDAAAVRCVQEGDRAFAVSPGARHAFRVEFATAGARQFVSTHDFSFVNAATGEPVSVPSLHGNQLSQHGEERVLPEGPAAQVFAFTIPPEWTAAVYEFRYAVGVRPLGATAEQRLEGSRTFLVLGTAPS